MIVITGTERSGTSLLMNLLREAGYPLYGEEFRGNWKRKLGEHNPNGFWESELRHKGVSPLTTNLLPANTKGWVIKLLQSGLKNSSPLYIEYIIIAIRDCKEYIQSFYKLLQKDKNFNIDDLKCFCLEEKYTLFYYQITSLLMDKFVKVPYIFIDYNNLMKNPVEEVDKLKKILAVGRFDLSLKKIDPSLYRNKEIDKSYSLNKGLISYNDRLKMSLLDGSIFEDTNYYMLKQVSEKIEERMQIKRYSKT